MEKEPKEIVRTTIDLPAGLNEKLVRAAGKAKRSRHAQMLVALEKFFEPPPSPTVNENSSSSSNNNVAAAATAGSSAKEWKK